MFSEDIMKDNQNVLNIYLAYLRDIIVVKPNPSPSARSAKAYHHTVFDILGHRDMVSIKTLPVTKSFPIHD